MNQKIMYTKKALVVEDEPMISRVCGRVLVALGFEVDFASNGRIALDMVRENQYELCLSDIRTPEMDGMEFYRIMQKECPRLAKSVIFTTGDLLNGKTNDFLKEVNRPYVLKPFSVAELTQIVKQTLEESLITL
jgi:CheY-like chemotaxis protein